MAESVNNFELLGEGEPEEGEDVEESENSAIIKVDDDFDIEGVKIPSGPFMPHSLPDIQGLTEAEVAQVLGGLSDADIEDLFQKNTESFRCLAQALISRSSIMRQILYHFPELEDPGIDEAFSYCAPEITFDDIGVIQYQTMCKDMNIAPCSRVIRTLNTDTLNLKYYGLSDKQFKAIFTSLMLNTYVKTLILEDNWISPEAALWLCEMLRENDSIKVLNLKECRLGVQGITNCLDGFSLNQSVREIDLSFNDLGDEGITVLTEALKDNYNVDKLNLSHNNLGELSGKLLGGLLNEHTNIDFLDLSWNNLYEGKAMAYLMTGIAESDGLQCLNLAWNGIGTPQNFGPLTKYLKSSEKLQYLDLSFNRLVGNLFGMLATSLKANNSLKQINLGFNLITPNDAIKLVSILNQGQPLEVMDLQNVFVNKDFIPILKKVSAMGKQVRIEGVLDNYAIVGPDPKKVVFDRCRYLSQKPKQKKLKKDFGSHFIWNLPEETVDNAALKKLVKKSKIKLDSDLVDMLGDLFSPKKKKIELKLMRDVYLELFPDTVPPPPPKKQKKDKRKKHKGEKDIRNADVHPTTEEKGIGTESLPMTESSLVSAKLLSGDDIVLSHSHVQMEMPESETVLSTIPLDEPKNISTASSNTSQQLKVGFSSKMKVGSETRLASISKVSSPMKITTPPKASMDKSIPIDSFGRLESTLSAALTKSHKSIAFRESIQLK